MRFLLIIMISGFIFLLPVKSQNFITPTILTTLSPDLNETSGLINLNGEIWTHTDNGGEPELYRINTTDGDIIRTVEVHDANNVDWEDIACDEDYVYIGDFGNNDGSRTNLKVYRISRSDLASSNDVDAEKIEFAYSDQTNFEPNYHYTNFDCEALTSFQDKLYLFSKNWVDNQTKVYELSKEPGEHIAEYLITFDVNCLVTGAEMISSLNTLLLTGYNESGGTYTWLFSGFTGAGFFEGNNNKLIWTTLTQAEGICYAGNNEAFVSSEKFAGVIEPTLFSLDLSGYMTQVDFPVNSPFLVFTYNNQLEIVTPAGKSLNGNLQIIAVNGNVMINEVFRYQSNIEIPLSFPKGIYLICLRSGSNIFSVKMYLAGQYYPE